jgi:hypothetical protein
MSRNATQFRSRFSTRPQICDLLKRHAEHDAQKAKIRDAEATLAGRNLLKGADLRSNFRVIYQWKLQSFLRFPWVQKFPEGVPREVLSDALAAVRRAKASDEDSVRRAFQAFTAIKGVRIPTASDFLATIRPKQFTIIDRQVYKALGVEFRSGLGET